MDTSFIILEQIIRRADTVPQSVKNIYTAGCAILACWLAGELPYDDMISQIEALDAFARGYGDDSPLARLLPSPGSKN